MIVSARTPGVTTTGVLTVGAKEVKVSANVVGVTETLPPAAAVGISRER